MGDFASDFIFDGDQDQWNDYNAEESYGEDNEDDNLYEEERTDRAKSRRRPRASSERYYSIPIYEPPWKEERANEAIAAEQEKKEQFRILMGMPLKRFDEESIKTVLSLEDENKEGIDEKSTSESDTHLCLKAADLSDSQLKLLDIFNDFPIPDDPRLVPNFYMHYPKPMIYNDDGIEKFENIVKATGVRPIASVKHMLQTDKLNLRYYGIDPRILRAICEALHDNTSVQAVDLRDNWLTANSCRHLSNLLCSNGILSCLGLSGCRIGPKGAQKLGKGIAEAPALLELDLSRCDLGDEGLSYIATAIHESDVLQDVNLSDNNLTDESAQSFNTLFTQATCLKCLNLSWNFLSGKEFSKIFFQGLGKNSTLEYLNVSWNALGEDCIPFLCPFLTNSQSLRELNVSGNRFTSAAAGPIGRALSKNFTIEILHIGDNPLTPAGAADLITAMTNKKSVNQLKLLDLQNVWFNKDMLPLLGKLGDVVTPQPWLILSNHKLREPDPKTIFLKRANFEAMNPKKKKLRKDFGHFVLSLKDEVTTKAIFKESVKSFKLKLTESLVDEIMKAFATPQGSIDQVALKKFYLMLYPDTVPPPSKAVKKKGQKKAS